MDTKTLANILRKLDEQSFRPGDSVVASTINHPIDAIGKFGGWLANQVNTAAGIPDLYDNPYPYLAPSPEAQTQAAFDVAGMAQLGSMPFAPKSAGGTVGTFIGPKAATWDAEKAATAAKLLDEGADPAQVWREHLIGRMPDGALFSEIPDNKAFYRGSEAAGRSYADNVYLHPELFDNYPGFKDYRVREFEGAGGSFNDTAPELSIGQRDASSTMAHELQHAIQQREGWARGGSPGDKIPLDVVRESVSEFLKPEFDRLLKIGRERQARGLGNVDPVEAYRRLTGEAQARATQDRLNMSMDERRNNYPLAGGKLSDIPLEQLIYRYGDNGSAMSASDNLNAELLQKYLQQGSLTPDELAQYERNAVAMRDSNRQYLNVANADAQGGTAMDRARDMGFFKNYYHGTIDDIDAIKTNLKPSQRVHGGGKINKDVFWVTTSPEGAGHFANMAAAKQAFGDTSKALQVKGNASGLFFDKPENISSYGEDFVQGQNITPVTWSGLRTRYDAQDAFNNASATKRRNTIISAIQDARELGRDAVRFDGVMDPIQQDTMAVLNPKSIRSIFAAFDPLRKDSADLLATKLLPASMLGLGMYGMEQERRNPLAEALRGQ